MIRRVLEFVVRLAFAIASVRFTLETLRSPTTMLSGAAVGKSTRSLVKRWLFRAVVLLAIGAIVGAAVVVTGIVPIKASSGHWSITEAFLQFAKRRSVAAHSMLIAVPPLDDPRLVTAGAGHYDFACRPCHGSPALEQPRVARQMLPRPPDLRKSGTRYDAEDLFYIVKHGIKLTGMPAWPALQRDDEVWAVVAFLRKLPELDASSYSQLARGDHGSDDAGVPIEDLLGPSNVPRAVIESCGRCHGVDGLGRGFGAFPRLAGQRPAYLAGSMQAYARGERHSGMMEPVAASLGPDEMQAIADYYSRLPPGRAATAAPLEQDRERGRLIATQGIPETLVPACATCHGPGTHRRNPSYPFLAGQYVEYIRLQLSLFKEDRRGGTAYRGIMRKIASQLTPEQIRDVAAFYASLPGGS